MLDKWQLFVNYKILLICLLISLNMKIDMKKLMLLFFIGTVFCFFSASKIKAQTVAPTPPPYEVCGGGCPIVTPPPGSTSTISYPCAASYDDWLTDKTKNFWVRDPEITALGKAGERSRQFLYWALNHRSIDNHPAILSIWSLSRNITYFLLIVVAAVMGLGIIIGKRYSFANKIEVAPLITKIALAFLYATFSAVLVLVIVQLSDTLMMFFTERLGVSRLFNIFFVQDTSGNVITTSETAYQTFQGCSNLSTSALESVKMSKLLVNITNLTYYSVGVMLILRKIVLWFLLFVSPFLAILLPFVFIRNIGLIWIGVFFQWVFYGPLFSLFLGALANIWNSAVHIPFVFDFSRTHRGEGFIYPTAINILYGGPAQTLDILNSSNYIDTFVEYVISLIMLWVVIVLPWLLLRIFRDYCCDGIYAAKNILLSIYDQMRGSPSASPPTLSPSQTTIGTALKIPREIEIPVKLRLETVEEIKKARTEDVTRSLNLQASRLTDVAHFETNRQELETANRNLNYLTNPTKAETPSERQKYMNIRTELFNRAVKDDKIAKQILSTISTSQVEQIQKKAEFIRTVPQVFPVTHVISIKVKIPQEKVSSLNSTLASSVSTNSLILTNISQATQLSSQQVQNILNSYQKNIAQPPTLITQKISEETGLVKDKVVAVLKNIAQIAATNKDFVKDLAQKGNISEEEVIKIVQEQTAIIAEPEKHIDQVIAIPPSISLEDYEEVKSMWMRHYEKGEVPTTENILTRDQWVTQDIVVITNTLNKLFSTDEKTRQQGLDDLGYILPIFLINNLKGEELAVYLKAKLEAAKAVKALTDKEKEITEKLKNKASEQFVEAPRPKEEEKKTLEAKEELKI